MSDTDDERAEARADARETARRQHILGVYGSSNNPDIDWDEDDEDGTP